MFKMQDTYVYLLYKSNCEVNNKNGFLLIFINIQSKYFLYDYMILYRASHIILDYFQALMPKQ